MKLQRNLKETITLKTAMDWIEKLDMVPHPEGGFYTRPHVSKEKYIRHDIPGISSSERKLWTSEYMLFEPNMIMTFHTLRSESVWYYHCGASLKFYLISPDGDLIIKHLGLDMDAEHTPQIQIPKNYAIAIDAGKDEYSLIGTMISPGFDMDDLKVFNRQDLLKRHPHHKDLIKAFTTESIY